MRKIGIFLSMILILATVSLLFVSCSCGEEAEPETTTEPTTDPVEDHIYGDWIAEVPASCTENGTKGHYLCSHCGKYFDAEHNEIVDIIITASHTEEVVPSVPATCTESGMTEGKICSVCREVLVEQQEIPAAGHIEEIIPAIPATCTENGLTEGRRCSVCGEVFVEQELISASGGEHNYEPGPTVEVTCTEGAYIEYTCTRCGDSYKQYTSEALGHDYQVSEVQYPDCTNGGYTVYTCSRCPDSYIANETEALGHDFSQIVNEIYLTNPADCMNAAGYYMSCARCGEADVVAFTYGEALGHDFSLETANEEYLKTPADCANPAVYYKSCSRCGLASETETFEHGAALEHEFTAEVAEEKYLKSGDEYYKSCWRCGAAGTETFEYDGYTKLY